MSNFSFLRALVRAFVDEARAPAPAGVAADCPGLVATPPVSVIEPSAIVQSEMAGFYSGSAVRPAAKAAKHATEFQRSELHRQYGIYWGDDLLIPDSVEAAAPESRQVHPLDLLPEEPPDSVP